MKLAFTIAVGIIIACIGAGLVVASILSGAWIVPALIVAYIGSIYLLEKAFMEFWK